MQRALFVYVWATWYQSRRTELAGNHELESYQGSADLVLAVHLFVDDDNAQTFAFLWPSLQETNILNFEVDARLKQVSCYCNYVEARLLRNNRE